MTRINSNGDIKIMKSLFLLLPDSVQRVIGWRLRRALSSYSNYILSRSEDDYQKRTDERKKNWIYCKVKQIAVHAYANNPFYNRYYKGFDFDPASLANFSDLSKIPIVTKELLRSSEEEWLKPRKNYSTGNTGGTSGNPLKFLSSKVQGNREHYYMQKVWARIGCTPSHARAVFRGVNLGNDVFKYNSYSDCFFVNMYKPLQDSYKDLCRLFSKQKIEYLHGYPSTIFQFATMCLIPGHEILLELANRNLKGVLLGSEYPANLYREKIFNAFPVPSISWYGHSEMVVLAAENNTELRYEPFHSYGFCEGVETSDGETHLVGTSYDNYASPFIRYDTEDSIDPISFDSGLLESFTVKNGRIGEFVIDRSKNKVSLTAFIFGRHHKAFECVDFIQISQTEPGEAVLHLTTTRSIGKNLLFEMFDFSNVDIEFSIEMRRIPIRTKSGKVPLLVTRYI